MNNDEQQNKLYQQGEVVEQKPTSEWVIRLDDGRILPHCYISYMHSGRRTDIASLLPKVGERIWVEESPYALGNARILINKKKYSYTPRGK